MTLCEKLLQHSMPSIAHLKHPCMLSIAYLLHPHEPPCHI